VSRVSADPTKLRKYEKLARGPYFGPVVDLARAYVAAAIADAAGTEGEYWALSCLPGTSPRRLSALTMRITDILVINKAGPPGGTDVEALMIVERSTFEEGFGRRALARRRYPRLAFTDSEYHGAGFDQMMISGPVAPMVRCLDDERIVEAARRMAEYMMDSGRVMHWRGHNPLLADHVLGRA
jgi:5-methylcytosine-specific restriction protein B